MNTKFFKFLTILVVAIICGTLMVATMVAGACILSKECTSVLGILGLLSVLYAPIKIIELNYQLIGIQQKIGSVLIPTIILIAIIIWWWRDKENKDD